MLTPTPYPLHLIVMGINPVAVDAVCTHIVGLNPIDVDHIRITASRGYGPLDLEEIEIMGDVSLDQAQERATGMRLTLERIEEIFNRRSNITTHIGPPPDTFDYCWGGCPGSFFEAMQIIESMQPNVYNEIRPIHVVMGAYKGEIHSRPGEPIFFMGDCTRWHGSIHGQPIDIPFLYKQRSQHNPYTAKSGDVVVKMLNVFQNLIRHRGQTVIRVKGCPVSVAENALYLSWVGKVINPYLHPKIFFTFLYHWSISKIVRLRRKLTRLFSSRILKS
jgi:hypothetical protein